MAQTLTFSRPLDGLRRNVARIKARAATLWRSHPRETAGLGILSLAVVLALGGIANSTPELTRSAPQAAPPAPPPLLIRQLPPEQALQVNEQIPIAQGPNPAARPFVFTGDKTARAQALECLASAVYYEAGSQDDNGQRAVAQVVLNRVRHPAFPASVCGVVYEGSTRPTGCQFTFTCDGSLNRRPDPDGWRRALQIAERALNGATFAPVGWATHYHADYVVPVWASTMAKNAVVGAHLFYRWAGSWGQPAAFARVYAGHEPNAAALRLASLAVPHITPVYAQGQLAKAIKEIPGAEPLKLSPSLRGDKRVAVRFNLAARKASDEVTHEDYANKFDVSDNLKWSLSNETTAQNQQPLGRPAATASNSASSPAAAATGQR